MLKMLCQIKYFKIPTAFSSIKLSPNQARLLKLRRSGSKFPTLNITMVPWNDMTSKTNQSILLLNMNQCEQRNYATIEVNIANYINISWNPLTPKKILITEWFDVLKSNQQDTFYPGIRWLKDRPFEWLLLNYSSLFRSLGCFVHVSCLFLCPSISVTSAKKTSDISNFFMLLQNYHELVKSSKYDISVQKRSTRRN